ncbi:MAG: VWA domain-containing protein [Chloroflexi bacterium]|nr:VWA domain-containing protein [Chloroflexota bacterium]
MAHWWTPPAAARALDSKEPYHDDRLHQALAQLQSQAPGVVGRLLTFSRMLKRLGLEVTTGRVIDACNSLRYIDIAQREDFHCALKANLISSHDDGEVFDKLFKLFWDTLPRPPAPPLPDGCGDEGDAGGGDTPWGEEEQEMAETIIQEWRNEEGEEEPGEEWVPSYSPEDVLTLKDFASFTDDEVRQVRRLIGHIAPRLATLFSRRNQVGAKGHELDMRRTLRRNLRHGGEIFTWARRRRKVKKLRVVVLCDVSGSMDCYSRFFVQFLYGMQNSLLGVRTFAFSTHITEITPYLRRRRFQEALVDVARHVPDWSGGTNIGTCLRFFNTRTGKNYVSSKTVVIVISDGWDKGEAELLEREMESLKRRCYKILWLNPLLGSAHYQPLCKGMKAALPYTDYFLPAHNLKSLVELGKTLGSLAPN